MRILHTSDWHLGRHFHGHSMLASQASHLDHLIGAVESEEVDLVVVSGDIYDRALPPVDAVALADDALSRLADSRARVVITSGNHDSARRLGFNSRLVDAAGVHLRTDAGQVSAPVIVEDRHGPVAVYGIPFLEPDFLKQAWDLPARSHHAALAEAIRRIRTDLAGRPGGTRSVVLAHAFVAGGQGSDSERDISVGGVSIVPTSLFEGFDYVALGHLHGRARLTEQIRYSGSPLAYSFSEAEHTKGSWLVELDEAGFASAQFLPAPVPRRLARISGTLHDLLTSRKHVDAEVAWVQARLTDPVRPMEAMAQLQQRFPHAVALQFAPAGAAPTARRAALAGRSDHDITLDFVRAVRGEEASSEESTLLRDAVDACCVDPQADMVVSAG